MKVFPKNDQVRKLLKHPVAKGFRAEGPAEWPDDSFTARRIADGDVTTEDPAKAAAKPAPAAPVADEQKPAEAHPEQGGAEEGEHHNKHKRR